MRNKSKKIKEVKSKNLTKNLLLFLLHGLHNTPEMLRSHFVALLLNITTGLSIRGFYRKTTAGSDDNRKSLLGLAVVKNRSTLVILDNSHTFDGG